MHNVEVLVVGAGSAGATVARRVADTGRQVLLVEEGLDYRSAQTPPEVHDVWPFGTFEDESLYRQFFALDVQARRTRVQAPRVYWQGRGVGGSSAVNGLFAVRPTVEDLDEWAAAGCAGWSYEDCLPFLRRMESDLDFPDAAYHGSLGPLPVRRPVVEDFQPLEIAVTSAAAAIGLVWHEDLNAPGATGVSPYPFNARDGRRVSTNDAYLEPVRGLDNLQVLGGARADRILIEAGRAVGVRILVGGESRDLRADEIVVSAGAFRSPALLMRSGIGPADHLRDIGIDVVADLPVGQGLQDHPGISARVSFNDDVKVLVADRRHSRVALRFDSGYDGEPNDLMVVAMNPANFGDHGVLVGWLNKVHSRGAVWLRSADPKDEPLIEFDLLSDPADQRKARALMGAMYDLLDHPETRNLATGVGLVDPSTGEQCDFPTPDDERLDALLLAAAHDVQHPTSTCRMGSPDDPGTVVDPQGRVLGVQGLRVADASILPSVPRANTHLSAVLVGEMVAWDVCGGAA